VGGFVQSVQVSFEHAMATFLRRTRTYVAGGLVVLPALVPLLILVLPREHQHGADVAQGEIVGQMLEIFYITGVTPLLALFFAAMLVGEDVETQTVAYVLTRPVSRWAWVLGRFCAYLAVTSGMILLSMAVLRLTVLPFPADGPGLGLSDQAQYAFAAVMSLLGYGALCTCLGTWFRHPVVVGVLIIFGWQQIATLAPGATNLLTIRKYVGTLLPGGGQSFQRIVEDLASNLWTPDIAIRPITAFAVLIGFSAVMLALAGWVVREKEYTTPVAVTE
jgi:ABC-type transport system involved in multi-copper enzyme maturation permease subunit